MNDNSEQPLIEPAARFWRLPIIRHVRTIWYAWQISRHDAMWRSLGFIPQSFDGKVLRQMWKGIV